MDIISEDPGLESVRYERLSRHLKHIGMNEQNWGLIS